ncbi:type II toxin-antitoxin system HicB family antitoxin [Clostridium paraputrificum]|uniref:type II toxin-antitoxin system HicB family antitoxin n=1 Tax=Clostridium paraputrificum TaxID=29363 RepID=UPI002330F432|nr:type II toxin-antitoxin system HicB family antitoxin [Clostridium paraputrificum]MDB2122156.1 type II toxin-antitoxin system HicB family antitoxin [Clostridium paraputrificum]
MKVVYPVILSKEKDGYFVSIPDFDMNTQGKDLADAIFMARDAIALMGITLEDEGEDLPISNSAIIKKEKEEDIITLIDVDLEEYRKRNDNRAVKKNCTIPYWLSVRAEKENINFSEVLREALKEKLKIR